ncbi:DUF1266 domain-containing protein [Paenibacillus sp. VCA1]|uniref:DUF1266 domain-containing protein n=1 Tax=Paenibacillus sp. VCA1 TaxID=3039148 RepID=UPI0028722F77|nr:DUF1266 domain-containing protein [Paenibacillus sp. VCA1]MDR9856647.1 DUF1266 domain-containing protein [Paenibacillus sp. VCA1]
MIRRPSPKKAAFYDEMTSALFAAGPVFVDGLYSYRHIPLCPKPALADWMRLWGISDSVTYQEKLRWLFYKGYRSEFDQISNRLSVLPQQARQEYIRSLPEQEQPKFICVNLFRNVLTSAGIAALDYALIIALCKIVTRLYISGFNNARSYSLEAAQIAQSKYRSWHEYQTACIAGVYFASPLADLDVLRFNFAQKLLEIFRLEHSIRWDLRLK